MIRLTWKNGKHDLVDAETKEEALAKAGFMGKDSNLLHKIEYIGKDDKVFAEEKFYRQFGERKKAR